MSDSTLLFAPLFIGSCSCIVVLSLWPNDLDFRECRSRLRAERERVVRVNAEPRVDYYGCSTCWRPAEPSLSLRCERVLREAR
jgi:hypothetical protein